MKSRAAIWVIVALSLAAPLANANNQAANRKQPNILLAIADDWGYGNASAYGCKWTKTPAFDRIAREGLLFTHAFTPNAKCAPSRACLLTGRNSWQLEAACNHICFFPTKFKTYCEALADHGYFVGRLRDRLREVLVEGLVSPVAAGAHCARMGSLIERLDRHARSLLRRRPAAWAERLVNYRMVRIIKLLYRSVNG